MAEHQQALAAAILKDPDVVSLSSFIGVDGSNMTLNSGRFLINLKPKDDRSLNATEIARRLQQETADVAGVSLYLQPVQDLTIDASVSRTQYQFVLENPNLTAFNEWVPKLVARAGSSSPDLANVASDLQQQGLTVNLVIDRATAARFGITPATVDNALYDLFGQRIISTIYTQSNQYRVIMEADPSLQTSLDALYAIYLPSAASTTGQVPLSAIVQGRAEARTVADQPSRRSSRRRRSRSTPRRVRRWAPPSPRSARRRSDIGLPDSFVTAFQGAAAALEASLSNELLLVLAAIVTVYIVLGVLYESFIHPITILSTLPSAGAGALVALLIAGDDIDVIVDHRHHPADRHRQEERHHDDRLRAGGRARGRQAAARGDPSGLPAALPPDPDDHDGGPARRAAADAGQRHRLGTAPAAGRGDRRRPDRQPGADAVHHAGDLPDVRPPGLRGSSRQQAGRQSPAE